MRQKRIGAARAGDADLATVVKHLLNDAPPDEREAVLTAAHSMIARDLASDLVMSIGHAPETMSKVMELKARAIYRFTRKIAPKMQQTSCFTITAASAAVLDSLDRAACWSLYPCCNAIIVKTSLQEPTLEGRQQSTGEPHQLADFCIPLLLSPAKADAAIGDLNERAHDCRQYGLRRARLYYDARTLRSLWPLVWPHLRRAVGRLIKWGVIAELWRHF